VPITLEKLFSATVSSSFEYMGETVNLVWAPARYTGEMYELAEKMDREIEETNEEIAALEEGETKKAIRLLARARQADRRGVRAFLAALLVSWDVMDGKRPYPTDEASLEKLDPDFLAAAFMSLGSENEADPQKPDPSVEPSEPKASPAPSRRGSPSSGELTSSGSPRGT
jgi:hypothetical protein